MAKVTIEGTGRWVGLARGQRRTVTLTDRIPKLVRNACVTIVEEHEPTTKTIAADKARLINDGILFVPQGESLPDAQPPEGTRDPGEATDSTGDDDEPDETVQDTSGVADEPPARNASRKEWAAWFDQHGLIYPPSNARDDFVAEWDRLEQERSEVQP